MSDRILYVDDDENILAACQRILRKRFDVETALGGDEGLAMIARNGPFAVVISDMRMPHMDGVEFLAKVRSVAPDTVRMMLTGNADLQTAVDAVNEGQIFRFLTKPCPKDVLVKAAEGGIEQYRLITAEKQLLEETLNGSIKVMADILSLVKPLAFGRAGRVRRYARHIADRLSLPNIWEIEIAAILSQVGCISLPDEILEKVYAGQDLSSEEQNTFDSHPGVGGRLIVNIPRLENASHMIARQQEPFSWDRSGESPQSRDGVALGGHILKVALDFDTLLTCGVEPGSALAELQESPETYDPKIVEALDGLQVRPPASRRQAVTVDELAPGMILDQDVRSRKGGLLVTKGHEVTIATRAHLRRWASGVGVEEPIRVQIAGDPATAETVLAVAGAGD